MRALAAVFGLLSFASGAFAACPEPGAIGLARAVEIDTRTGPLYGHHTGYQKQTTFLKPKEVVLTFDDGPMPWITKAILDTLDRHCTKATFFSVGRMAIAYPATTREILARGHTLGTHTWSHPLNLKRLKPKSAIDEIERGFAAVAAAAGQPIAPFFRFPGLNDNAAMLTHLQSRGVGTFTVDAISNDSYIREEAKLVATTMAQVEARQGGIILFHDIKATTARALPTILAQLQARGYKVVHMQAADGFQPKPDYAPQLTSLLAKSQGRSKTALVPFYDAMPKPDGSAPATTARLPGDVPVAKLAPEAVTFVARANEAGSGRPGVKRPLVRTAAVTSAELPRRQAGARPQRVEIARPAQTQASGWFGGYSTGWTTSVQPTARLRRGAYE